MLGLRQVLPLTLRLLWRKGNGAITKRLKNTWERVTRGDLLLFYVTSPVCGVVGIASVKGKAEENNVL
ncbi:MAG: hypothetical protein FGF50_11195 [Candidatus Brockarchaeota archaeon]|nr:hypothetical protein [Candidatus Brockarchaeota archaeon]